MEKLILKDLFCELCDLQFDKKSVYDIHMSFVHKKRKIKDESVNEQIVAKREKVCDFDRQSDIIPSYDNYDANAPSVNKKANNHLLIFFS